MPLSQVEIYEHTLHIASSAMAEKNGCNVFFRRALRGHSLLTYLVQMREILTITSECLERLTEWKAIRLPKTATKATRIRKILELEEVKERCCQSSIDGILATLQQQEENRKKKKAQEEEKLDEVSWLHHSLFVSCSLFSSVCLSSLL